MDQVCLRFESQLSPSRLCVSLPHSLLWGPAPRLKDFMITFTILPMVLVPRDEINRKIDHKRQEISNSQQSLRQLEDSVHKLKEEKVWWGGAIIRTSSECLVCVREVLGRGWDGGKCMYNSGMGGVGQCNSVTLCLLAAETAGAPAEERGTGDKEGRTGRGSKVM